MISFTLIHVGEFKEKYLKEGFEEYRKRISGKASFEDIFIKEVDTDAVESESAVLRALDTEGREILSKCDPRSYKIALCVEGKERSSEELSALFEEVALSGKSRITFIIGSSHGLSDKVKKEADLKLSFSKMTFPHQLMRLILMEQIYRGIMIANGSKYHK